MKRLLASTILAAGIMSASGLISASAQAAECGDVTISNMNWQSAELLSNLDKIILSAGYGCNAEIVVGDTVPTITSMVEKGQPDIAPEGWVDLLPDIVKKGFDDGKIIALSESLPDGGEQGWWIPKYIADKNPDLKTFDDLLKHPELFPDPETPSKGAIYNGAPGWGGTVVTSQFYKAFEFEKAGFNLIDTGSAAGLDGAIAKANERNQPIVAFYWAPTALLGKYEMVMLKTGYDIDEAEWKRCNTVLDCPDPKKNGWPKDRVETLVTKKFSDRAGPALDYLKNRSWSNETLNKLLAWMTDNQATGEQAAVHFLKTQEDMWTKWVPADVAEKVKAAL